MIRDKGVPALFQGREASSIRFVWKRAGRVAVSGLALLLLIPVFPANLSATEKPEEPATAVLNSPYPTLYQIAQRRRRRRYGQSRPEPKRIREIQQALIKVGYLKGSTTGRWDKSTRAAMKNFQEDHGFRTTGLPEAKTLMKLGLGPHPLPPEFDLKKKSSSSENPPPEAPSSSSSKGSDTSSGSEN